MAALQIVICYELKSLLGVKFCRMTLLLGLPGSGKTTLLMALAGRLASDLKVGLSSSFKNQILRLKFIWETPLSFASNRSLGR